jgi:hypothetical protein
MRRITVAVCAAVRVDFVNVSHSAYHGSNTISTQMADMAFPADSFHYLPRGIAAALRAAGENVPVFAVCRFRRVAEAEAMLAARDIAMVGMARAHIADPHLLRKAREGREAETRLCVGCNQGCAGFVAQSLPITCLVNPDAGREAEASPAPVAVVRRVLVIGGGPAGMEAAATAARNGHAVTLWESRSMVGGALRLATTMPLRRDFGDLLDAQTAALARAGVTLVLGRRATAADILDFGADDVIFATGARPAAMALAAGTALTMEQALADETALGTHVVVQDNFGSWALAGLTEYLAGTGRRVTVLAPTGTPFAQVNIYSGYAFRQRLKDKGVRILTLHAATALEGTTLRLTELSTGDETALDNVDALVAPVHAIPDDALATELAALAGAGNLRPRVASVGDCVAARSALEAVFEGREAGRATGALAAGA